MTGWPDPSPGRRFEGRTVLVVGAGQTAGATLGNGRAAALHYAAEGADLLLVDRDAESLACTAEKARGSGGRVEELSADIATSGSGDALQAAIAAFTGRVDVLHNNVGIAGGDGPPHVVDEPSWQRILDVNLTGTWRVCRHIVPLMRVQGSGVIVNVSSIAGLAATAALTAYSVSKAALNALTRALALDNAAHGIRVNAVLPGLIDTPMGVDAVARDAGLSREAVAAARAARSPTGRQGSASDVARAALFLASDDAAFITGALLPVDGGQSIGVC